MSGQTCLGISGQTLFNVNNDTMANTMTISIVILYSRLTQWFVWVVLALAIVMLIVFQTFGFVPGFCISQATYGPPFEVQQRCLIRQ